MKAHLPGSKVVALTPRGMENATVIAVHAYVREVITESDGVVWRVPVGNVWSRDAAPDLLLAAEQVVKESEPPTDESDWEPSRIRFASALDNLRTAIARARGKES